MPALCPGLQHKSDMERRLVGPASGMPGSGQAADADDLASEAAGLRLQLVEALEELEARERELRDARDSALGQHHKMQALSDQVRSSSWDSNINTQHQLVWSVCLHWGY
jgi:hypothetical protein